MGDLSGFFTCARSLQTAVFVALIEKAEAVSFIMDCLDPVRPFSAEKEQGIAVRIKLKAYWMISIRPSGCFLISVYPERIYIFSTWEMSPNMTALLSG